MPLRSEDVEVADAAHPLPALPRAALAPPGPRPTPLGAQRLAGRRAHPQAVARRGGHSTITLLSPSTATASTIRTPALVGQAQRAN